MSPFQNILAIHRATSQTGRENGRDFEELIRTTDWSEIAISSPHDSKAPCN